MKITKKEISDTAIELFLQNGYSQVTIQNICDKLGITKPTFYNYISSKEDLILDLYDTTISSLLNNPHLLVSADSHYEQLLVVFATLIHDTKQYGADLFSQMFISNLKENHHSFDKREALTKLCHIILKKAQESGDIHNKSDVKALYDSVAYCFTGYEVMWCISNDQLDLEEEFYKAMNAIVDVDEKYKDLYKKYI